MHSYFSENAKNAKEEKQSIHHSQASDEEKVKAQELKINDLDEDDTNEDEYFYFENPNKLI